MGLNIHHKNNTLKLEYTSKSIAKRKSTVKLKDLTFKIANKKDIEKYRIKSYDFVL
jgi:hypothetical protein